MPLTPQTARQRTKVIEPDFPELPKDFKDEKARSDWYFGLRKNILEKLESVRSQIPKTSTVTETTTVAGEKGDTGERGRPGLPGDTVESATGTLTKSIMLCAAYTPTAVGADKAEVTVPYAEDGATSVTWAVRRLVLRVGVAGGQPSMTIEKSRVAGAFAAETVGTVLLVSGSYEGSATEGLGTVASGDKLRFNVSALGTAGYWTVIVEVSKT